MIAPSSAMDHLAQGALILAAIAHVGIAGKKLASVGPVQYFLHKIYAIIEPSILRVGDFFITRRVMTETRAGRFLLKLGSMASHFLPHGIALTTKRAGQYLELIEKLEGPKGARLAVGPCVCQRALDRWQEPSCKDIVLLYGAEIYLHLDLGYRVITAKEGKKILDQCAKAGYVHSLDFCMQSGRWNFVVCNCDRDICVLTRTHNITRKFLYPGPDTVTITLRKCLGMERCGACAQACMFGAAGFIGNWPAVDETKCLGCGQCARVCRGKARRMIEQPDYRRGEVFPALS